MAQNLDDVNQNINITVNENGATNAERSIDNLNVTISETTDATNQNTAANRQAVQSSAALAGQTTRTTGTMHNLEASFEDVYGELQPLTSRMGEAEDRLYELALAGEQATDEFQALLETVANYRRTQIQVDQVVDAAATTLGEKLGGATQIAASGISLVTSGFALFGKQSEETEKALLKVQAAMAFADSVSSLNDLRGQFTVFRNLVVDGYRRIVIARQAEIAATTQATIAQRILNLTALANPYVLLGAAIAAVGVVTYAWIKASQKEAEALRAATEAVGQNKVATEQLSKSIEDSNYITDTFNNLEVARAKALGASDEQIQKMIQSQKELAIATSRTFASEAYQNVLKAMEAARAARSTMNDELIKDAEDNQKTAEDLYRKANDAFNNSIVAEAENRLAVQADTFQKEKDARQKAADERKKQLDEQHKSEQELIRAQGEEARARYEQEVKDYVDFRLKLVSAKVQAEFDEAERVKEALDEITKGEDERLLARLEQENKIEQYRLDQKKVITDKGMEVAQSAFQLAGILAGKNKGLQKAAIIGESAVGVGRTVQGVFTGNAAALAQGIAQAGPIAGPALATPAIVLNSVQGGLSVAGNIAATTKALSALGGGSAPSAGANTSGSSASGGGATRNVAQVGFQGSSESQIANALSQSQKNQPPVQAFVVSQAVTDQQELDRKKELNNSF